MIDKLLKIIVEIVRAKFTGSLTLNFYQGNISTIERKESMKI